MNIEIMRMKEPEDWATTMSINIDAQLMASNAYIKQMYSYGAIAKSEIRDMMRLSGV